MSHKLHEVAWLLAVTFSLLGTAHAQLPPTNGLVAYYPLNGDAMDASANGNNGTNYGIAWASDRFGNANAACRFYGNGGSYIDIPPSQSLDFPDEITIAAWCAVSGPGTFTPRLISIDSPGTPFYNSYQLAASAGGGDSLNLTFLDLVGGVGFSPQWMGNITNGQWVHLAVVGTRTDASIYVDGVPVATQSGPEIGPAPQPTLLSLGRLTVPAYDAFDGVLDDVRIYNRALSDSEIQQLHDFEPPRVGPSLHIIRSGGTVIMWWPTNFPGFGLEATTSIGADQNWVPLNWPILVIGDQNVVAADASIGRRFFRLRKP